MPEKEGYEICERLNADFKVAYSEAGISKFGCPRGSINVKGISCEATHSENCPVLARLEGKIKDS